MLEVRLALFFHLVAYEELGAHALQISSERSASQEHAPTVECESSSTVLLTLQVPSHEFVFGTQWEAQLALAEDPNSPLISQTATTEIMSVGDLLPGTTYSIRIRHRDPYGSWTSMSVPTTCSTRSLQPSQPWISPPRVHPTRHSVMVDIQPPTLIDKVNLEFRVRDHSEWQPALEFTRVGDSINLSGLTENTTYEVKAVGTSQGLLDSDPVMFSTANSEVDYLTTFRFSEKCGDTQTGPGKMPCNVDFLYNRDTGDILADTAFIIYVGSHELLKAFSTSVMTKYCISKRHEPYADYVSCDGPDSDHYECRCSSLPDKCMARYDVTTCDKNSHECKCSEESLNRSAHIIGRAPVYHPLPNQRVMNASGECTYNSGPESLLGYWYSFPAKGECPQRGCTWSRQSRQHFLHGAQLISLGLNTSKEIINDVAQLNRSADIIENAFLQNKARCCGC